MIYTWITPGKPFTLLVDCLLQSSSVFCEYLCCLWNDMFVSLNNRRSEGGELLISWADVSSDHLWGIFNVVGAEDSPDLLYPPFPLPLHLEKCIARLLCLQTTLFEKCLWPFFFFFGQVCHFAMFQTKSCVAVSIAWCPGEGVVYNHIEPLRSRAVKPSYPDVVEVNHIQLAKTLGGEHLCLCLQNILWTDSDWSPEAATAVFQKVQ